MHIAFFDVVHNTIRLEKQMEAIRRAGDHRITLVRIDSRSMAQRWHTLCDQVIDVNLPGVCYRSRFAGKLYRATLRKRLASTIRELDCDLLHVFGTWNDMARTVIETASCPCIYDVYDFAGIRKGVGGLPKRGRNDERFCLEHADGIVTKFPDEILGYYRGLGYQLPGKILHYMDYCDDTSWITLEENRARPEQWHLVQGGGVSPASWPRREHGYQQYHEVARSLAKQGVHFHIYPNPTLGRLLHQYACYRDLAKQEGCFHFHDPLPFAQFRKTISGYHWGAWIHPPEAPQLAKYYWYGIGNKLTVYLEAGLPLVANRELLFGSSIVEANDIGVTFDFADLDRLGERLDAADWSRLRENVGRFREQHSIGRQCHRLVSFYETLCTKATWKRSKARRVLATHST